MRFFPTMILLLLAGFALPAQERAALLFREDWKELPAATPVTQAHVANPALTLHRYGPAKDEIKKSHHDQPKDDPYYVWSGECKGAWAVALRHQDFYADLTGAAKIRWRAKQSGGRELRVILKLAHGAWLVSEQSDGPSAAWREYEFNLAALRWRALNIETVTTGDPVAQPDLRRVDEVGFTDLMAGGRTPASSRLDWIEVWGKARPRSDRKTSSLVYPGQAGEQSIPFFCPAFPCSAFASSLANFYESDGRIIVATVGGFHHQRAAARRDDLLQRQDRDDVGRASRRRSRGHSRA